MAIDQKTNASRYIKLYPLSSSLSDSNPYRAQRPLIPSCQNMLNIGVRHPFVVFAATTH
jgi:hypothetical protein